MSLEQALAIVPSLDAQGKAALYNSLLDSGYSDAQIRAQADKMFGDQSQYWSALTDLAQSARQAGSANVQNAIQQATSFLNSPENLRMAEGAATMQQVTLPDGRMLNVFPDGTAQEFTSAGRVKVYDQSGNVILNQTQEEYKRPGYLTPVVNALMAAAGGAVLGPAGAGLLSTPAAAAVGSGGTTLLRGGSIENALASAALAGLTAYGVEGLFGGGAGTNAGGQSALDLTLADDITNLSNLGLNSDQISSVISTNYGIDPFMAADVVNSALGTTAGTTAGTSNLVNILGSNLPASTGTTLFSTGAGSLLGAGVGNTLTNTPTDTTSTTDNTNTQSTTITGTTLGTGAGSTLGSLVGTSIGPILGTLSTTPTSRVDVEGPREKPVTPPTLPTPVVPTPVTPRVEVIEPRDTCPAPEMQIMLADKTHKSAGDLKVGEKVLTQHEHTLEWGAYPVIYKELIPNAKRVKVSFDDAEFIGSWDHKFFVSVDNWVTIKNLKAGDIVGGKVVKSIEDFDEGPVVFLTIENAHTYVCQGVLSHNKSKEPPTVTPPVVLTPTTPTTTTTTPPKTTTTTDNNLNLADLLRLLTLFGGLGGMMGSGTTTGTGTLSTPPSDTLIGSTTPQFGPDYYAAVQRYYNAYMPETPRNVATPLQQWYENKFGA